MNDHLFLIIVRHLLIFDWSEFKSLKIDCLTNQSRSGISNKGRGIVSLKFSVNPVHSLLGDLLLIVLLLILRILLSAASRCASSSLQLLIPLISVIFIVVGVRLVTALTSESGDRSNRIFSHGGGASIGSVVGGGALTGGAAGVRSFFLAGVGILDDLAVALADGALDVYLLVGVEKVEGAESHDGDHRNDDGNVERGE